MRLDKYLSWLARVPRRQFKKTAKKWLIAVNNEEVRDGSMILNEWDTIQLEEYEVVYREVTTLLLHKPAGYISHDQDEHGRQSYRQLLTDCPYTATLHSAGRLDQDTTGLLVLTNDGDLIHRIISPKHECHKTYTVVSKNFLSDKDLIQLNTWVKLDTGYVTKPWRTKRINKQCIELSITEWKFHQVKKMLEAINNEVVSLQRISIWEYELWELKEGEWKYV